MARPKKVTDDQIAAALLGACGIISDAAKIVALSRQWVSARISDSPALQEARDEAKAQILDTAESALFKAVRAGDPWSIRFVLSRLGRDRGYGAKLEIEGQIHGKVVVYLPDDRREDSPNQGDSHAEKVLPDVT